MPKRPLKPCSAPHCPELVAAGERFCGEHLKKERKRANQNRDPDATKLYNYRWNKYTKIFLRNNPLCQCDDCRKKPVPLPANVVDHIIPHKGDYELFWDSDNHQAMDKRCHDRKTARENKKWRPCP